MPSTNSYNPNLTALKRFLHRRRSTRAGGFSGLSLFSGAGLSDLGYEMAGFRFVVQVELDADRAQIGQANFPHSHWIEGDVHHALSKVVDAFHQRCSSPLDLLVVTPPCQGMSSSNPSRGKRNTEEARANEWKNRLLLEVIPYAKELQPRVIVAENVRQILTLEVSNGSRRQKIQEVLQQELPEYRFYAGVINVSDYGIPQDRRRGIFVGVRTAELWFHRLDAQLRRPWPRRTHARKPENGLLPWVSVGGWLRDMDYEELDSGSPEKAQGRECLHFVPHYDGDRYRLVRDIPANSGLSAYANDRCSACGKKGVPEGMAYCPFCGAVMRNRPLINSPSGARLIRGFMSSYRRMHPNEPAPTVTTNSSHVGSDNKIHPWEHRVLSILECADLQTVPRWFDWSKATDKGRRYLIRNLIGEAFPPYFTYLHGRVLIRLLNGNLTVLRDLASGEE